MCLPDWSALKSLCPVCCSLDPGSAVLGWHRGYVLGVWQLLSDALVYTRMHFPRYIEPPKGLERCAAIRLAVEGTPHSVPGGGRDWLIDPRQQPTWSIFGLR